jgi:hypothetical protein
MLSETVKEIIKDAERNHRKLWLIMTVSSTLWLLLGYLTINHSGNSIPRNVNTSFIYLLYVVAFGLGVLSVGLRYYLLSNRRIEVRITEKPNLKLIAKNRQTGEVDCKRLEELNKLETYEQRLVTLPGWILNRSVYSWGVNSMIVFTGYIVGTLTKSFAIIVPFMVGALILDFIMFPMLQKIIENANRDSDRFCK